jgi:lysophospholipase L1-like esterase
MPWGPTRSPRQNEGVTSFRRYVAIGDSSTEGLMDPDGEGGFRGWADRLAQHLADAQADPVEYANLAVRGLHAGEILRTQLEPALALGPDLMSVFAGVNDVVSMRCDFGVLREALDGMFGAARATGATVVTFTMPDPGAVNPLVRHLRPRMFRFNRLVRSEAVRHGVHLVDFEAYPVAIDPRLWFADRLHNSPLGHERIAAAVAWRLGVDGFDESWAEPLPDALEVPTVRETVSSDLDWVVHHFSPWLGKAVRHVPHGLGISARRPVPTVVPPSSSRDARQR